MFSQIQALTLAHSHAQNTNVLTLSLPHKEHTFSHIQVSPHSLTEKKHIYYHAPTYKHAYILINTHMLLYSLNIAFPYAHIDVCMCVCVLMHLLTNLFAH